MPARSKSKINPAAISSRRNTAQRLPSAQEPSTKAVDWRDQAHAGAAPTDRPLAVAIPPANVIGVLRTSRRLKLWNEKRKNGEIADERTSCRLIEALSAIRPSASRVSCKKSRRYENQSRPMVTTIAMIDKSSLNVDEHSA